MKLPERLPTPREIKNKLVENPYVTYYGLLGLVLAGTYAIARKNAQAYDPYSDFVMEDMYNHMKAGDHLVVNYENEKFYYAPFDPDKQAS